MANRIIGNVIIVDSGMGNVELGGAASSMSQYRVSTIAVYSLDTTASVIISGANTTDVIARFDILSLVTLVDSQGTAIVQNPTVLHIGPGINLEGIKVPVVTAATAFFYLA